MYPCVHAEGSPVRWEQSPGKSIAAVPFSVLS